MKENTVVLSLEELDRLREIEDNWNKLESGLYCYSLANYGYVNVKWLDKREFKELKLDVFKDLKEQLADAKREIEGLKEEKSLWNKLFG